MPLGLRRAPQGAASGHNATWAHDIIKKQSLALPPYIEVPFVIWCPRISISISALGRVDLRSLLPPGSSWRVGLSLGESALLRLGRTAFCFFLAPNPLGKLLRSPRYPKRIG